MLLDCFVIEKQDNWKKTLEEYEKEGIISSFIAELENTKTIWQMLEKIGPHGKFIDLGSGDGKVVLLASNFAKKAVGIEWDSELHSIAVNLAGKLGAKNAEFINGDFK